jgi:ppGpp synthetase/RelA/SpoT-type nucleotidyltranferase
MEWATPLYSKRQVDKAGDILSGMITGDKDWSLQVVNNWRTAHSFPLNTLQMRLRTYAKNVESSPVVAQRIKRLSSIDAKLQHEETMHLSQMQDIGGCRAVLSNVAATYELRELYNRSNMRHELVKENDYILEPKVSGYRSIHRVYRYFSDKKTTYNGLLIEVQIRSQLQHAWATAVETVQTFLKQALKASLGDEDWLRFFVLMGSALAVREGKPLVPNTPTSAAELVRELKEYVTMLKVEEKLRAYHATLRMTDLPEVRGSKYFLLELRPSNGTVKVTAYREKDLSVATDKYLEVEQTFEEPGSDEAVLVSVEHLDSLKRAFPNYFLDTGIFLEAVNTAIK